MFRRNAGVIALMPDREPFELGISELRRGPHGLGRGRRPARGSTTSTWRSQAVGIGFQIATHLVDGDPPDVDGATRFCTRMFMGGVRALVED